MLADNLQKLSVGLTPQLWTFGWDASIVIEDDESKKIQGSVKVCSDDLNSFDSSAHELDRQKLSLARTRKLTLPSVV